MENELTKAEALKLVLNAAECWLDEVECEACRDWATELRGAIKLLRKEEE